MIKSVIVLGVAMGVGICLYLCQSPFLGTCKWLNQFVLVFGTVCVAFVYFLPFPDRLATVDPEGKAVFITGCDSGFGYLLAKRLHDKGFTVFAGCLASDREGALTLKRETSSRLHVLELDVTDDFHVQRAHLYVNEHLDGKELWAVVNNAGQGIVSEIEWCSVDQFRRVLDVNVLGVVRVTKVFLPLLRHSEGRVINVASLAGRLTMPMFAAYSMSKKAVVGFSDGLRQEMMKFDVSVVTIEPGLYKTPISVADFHINSNKKAWSETPTDIKEDYGEEYFDAAMVKIREGMDRARPQVEEVIGQMEQAVCARKPDIRYVPYWKSRVRSEILCHLPSSWTDKIFASSIPNVKPKLIVRQESLRAS